MDRTHKKRKRRGIQSIDTGIRVLEALENSDGPLALKDLSAQSELDPSSAFQRVSISPDGNQLMLQLGHAGQIAGRSQPTYHYPDRSIFQDAPFGQRHNLDDFFISQYF